jgi:hypothetical protein
MYMGIVGRTNLLQVDILMEIQGNTLKGKDWCFNEDDHHILFKKRLGILGEGKYLRK